MKIQEGTSLAEYANEYLKTNKISKSAFADNIGVSRSMVSLYLSGKYNSDSTTIETAITKYFDNENDAEKSNDNVNININIKDASADEEATEVDEKEVKSNTMKDFFESNDATSVVAVCNLCQQIGGLGIVVGKSGYGKTYSLKQYSKMGRVCYVECDDSMTSRDLVDAIGMNIGIPRGSGGTVWNRVRNIKDFFDINEGYLLIIDEADKLLTKYSAKKMEIIRTIFDQCGVGLIVAGEPALESMLKLYLPRFANRADYFVKLKGLSNDEVKEYLSDMNIEADALDVIVTRGINNQTGCFRLLNRTMKNIIRIKNDSQGVITKKDITVASNMMML